MRADPFERLVALGWGQRDWVEHDPDYDALRDDLRFQELLAKLKVLNMMYFDADPDDDRLKDAVTLAKKAVELDDQDALNHFAFGRVLLACKSYDDALAELELAAELNPSLAVVYCGLGDSHAYADWGGDPVFREGDQPQPVRSATLGVLLVPGARASVRRPVSRRGRMVAQSDPCSPIATIGRSFTGFQPLDICSRLKHWRRRRRNCCSASLTSRVGGRGGGCSSLRIPRTWSSMSKGCSRLAYGYDRRP
jgi:hypothetical protein